VDNSLSTELSASKYYIDSYAQESVDKVGQNPWITQRWPAGGRWPRPPLGRFGGGDCGGTKQLQKKFLKKIKNQLTKQVKLCKNVNSINSQLTNHENEASDSHNQGSGVDRFGH
jgi:hypothetical protein